MMLRVLHMMLGSNINIAHDTEKNAHDVESEYWKVRVLTCRRVYRSGTANHNKYSILHYEVNMRVSKGATHPAPSSSPYLFRLVYFVFSIEVFNCLMF